MKIRKTSAFIIGGFLSLFLLITGSSFAQDGSKEQKATALTDSMKTRLSMNDDQYRQVYAINLDFLTKVATVKEDSGGKMAKFKKLKGMDEERDASLKKVLTEQQFKDFQVYKQENRKEMKSRYKNQ
jgi:hypothetical protein